MKRLAFLFCVAWMLGCSSEPELIEAPRCLGLTECDG